MLHIVLHLLLVFMRKIAIIAYMIHDLKGSEYSVAYNHIILMSSSYIITIYFGTNGPHMGDIDGEFLRRVEDLENVELVFVKPSRMAMYWNRLNKEYGFKLGWNVAYRIWQRQIGRMDLQGYDIVHLLNPIGFNEPGFLYHKNLNLVWGPIGGIYLPPYRTTAHLPLKARIYYSMRRVYQAVILRIPSSRPRKMLAACQTVLVAHSDNLKLLKRNREDLVLLAENGILNYRESRTRMDGNKIRLLFVGSLDERKGILTLLKVLKRLDSSKFELHIAGEGPLSSEIAQFISKNKLEEIVKCYGRISRDEVIKLMANMDLNILLSINEGNPNTLWEAMSVGLPTMSLNHCGMKDTICSKCGILIPLMAESEVIEKVVEILVSITKDDIKALDEGLVECRDRFLHDKRKEIYNEIYG